MAETLCLWQNQPDLHAWNQKMPRLRLGFRLALAFAVLATAGPVCEPAEFVPAQAVDQPGAVEIEQLLFVQAPQHANPQDGIVLVWLPEPLQRLCLGKTAKQCATIDYCIRTTNRDVAMCRNLGINLARIPVYPAGTRPRRMISLELSRIYPMKGNGFELLQNFYKSAPRASLERLSMSARVKARIQFIRKPDDDDFNLIQVIAAPPF